VATTPAPGPILNGIPSQLPDTDPEETQEWVE
jgi:pyruvate dehydrogenase E1 component